MSTDDSRGNGSSSSVEGTDFNLELILLGYVDRINRGESVEPAEVYADHPEVAGEILEQLEAFQGIDFDFRSDPPLGTLGDYTLRRQIGRGGMGVVYEAWQNSMSQIIERDPAEPRRLNPRVPKDLETIVLKCLRKEPEDRYGTAEALAQDLRRFVRGDPVEARPQPTWQRLATLGSSGSERSLPSRPCSWRWSALWGGWRTGAIGQGWKSNRQGTSPRSARCSKHSMPANTFSRRSRGSWKGISSSSPAPSLARMTPEEIEALWRARETHPVEEAARELAGIAEAVGEPDAHYHLARAYIPLGRESDAKSEILRALEQDPDFAPARVLDLDLEEFSTSRLELEAIWREYKARSDWRSAWVAAHKSVTEQNWSRAIEAYGELIESGKRGSEPYIGCVLEAYIGRGMARLELDQHEKAKGDFYIASDRAPGSIAMVLLLGKAQYLGDATAQAEDTFNELYDAASTEEKNEAALWIAGVYYSVKDYQRGLDWTDKLGDDVPIKERLRSYFLFRSGETEKAIDAGREAIKRNKRDLVAHLVLASALSTDLWRRRGSDRQRTLVEFFRVADAALKLDSENASARGLLAQAEAAAARIDHLGRQIMRQTRNSRALSLVVPLFVGLSGIGQAQEGFFDDVEKLGGDVNSPAGRVHWGPCVSVDGLWLYFGSNRPDGFGGTNLGADLYVATRDNIDAPFGNVINLAELNRVQMFSNHYQNMG